MLYTKPSDPSLMIDLNTVVAYKSPDINLIEWLRKYVDEQLPSQINRAVYSTDILIRQDIQVKTATEINNDMQPLYDVLYGFGQKVGAVWTHIYRIFAAVSNVVNPVIHYVPAKDFKMKTREMLLLELKSLNETGVDSSYRVPLLQDLLELLLMGNEKEFNRIKLLSQIKPWYGKTPEEIDTIISMDYTKKSEKVLYLNFDTIVKNVEDAQDGLLYEKTYKEVKDLINAELELYMSDIDAAQPVLNLGEILV
jgi:hypothetical protein